MELRNYADFVAALLQSGFSMGGGNDKGVFAIVPFVWEQQDEQTGPIRWHTGDPETDPWEWRMRVLEERHDIAYAKLFFGASGYITRAWYPSFLAVRRGGESFEEAYAAGTVSHAAKRVYQTAAENGPLPTHTLKQLAGFTREDAAAFARALLELQGRMYLTVCGRAQKRNRYGEAYGWSSDIVCTTEQFWPDTVFQEAEDLSPEVAYQAIEAQIYRLNPSAEAKKARKFIMG